MDQDGLAAELIYASVGMGISMHRDAQYKDACMWAYNRWLAEMCSEAPERIFRPRADRGVRAWTTGSATSNGRRTWASSA